MPPTHATGAMSRAKSKLQIVVKQRAEHGRHGYHEQRVAVGCGTRDGLRRKIGARTRPVLDHERLAELLRQPVRDQPSR